MSLRQKIKIAIVNFINPDYKKIKSENEILIQDIYYLIKDSNGVNGIRTKTKWKVKFDIDEAVMQGDAKYYTDGFTGIYSQINHEPEN